MANRSRWQQDVLAKLAAARRLIRRELSLLGAAKWLTLLGGLFWLLDGWDLVWFAATKLEQPLALRRLLGAGAGGLLAGFALWWVATRLSRPLSDESIALAIQRRRPELQDRLITAVQSQPADEPLTAAMLSRTQRAAADALADWSPSELIDRRPLIRWGTAAVLLVGAVAVTAAVAPSHLSRWAEAYLQGEPDYWDRFRRTRVSLAVARGVPEQIVPFDSARRIRAARGATLAIVATVDDGTERPDRVRLTVTDLGAEGDDQTVSMIAAEGDGPFRHTLPRLFDDVELSIVAGDYATAKPYVVEVVEPPRVDALIATVVAPDYMNLGGSDRFVRGPVQSSRVPVPVGASVSLGIETNKPVAAVRVTAGDRRVELSPNEITTLGLAAVPPDGAQFHLPLVLGQRAVESPPTVASLPTEEAMPIEEPTELEISLVDTDGLRSLAPLSLTIEPVADLPPVVAARPRGIGTAVTRRALIPWSGSIVDDYGVTESWFRVRVGQADAIRQPIDRPTGPKTILLDPPGDPPVRIDLREIDPRLEQVLELSIAARDANPADDARPGRSEAVRLTVVSDDELLAILRGKELNLRLRFESIVEEVRQTRDDIRLQIEREEQASGLPESPERLELRQGISAGLDRDVLAVRKNESESAAIASLFADLRAEIVNNRLDTRKRLDRIDNGVLTPLTEINDRQFPAAERDMERAQQTVRRRDGDGQAPIAAALASVQTRLDRLVESLERVLGEMERRQSVNELIEELQRLTERYEDLQKRTKEKTVDDFFDDLLE